MHSQHGDPVFIPNNNVISQPTTGGHAGCEAIPLENDVIFGRGSGCSNHPGNVRLYHIVDCFVASYEEGDRATKIRIVSEILKILKSENRRFIQSVQATGKCYIASLKCSKEKISHAMRYRLKLKHAEKGSRQNSSSSMLRSEDENKVLFTDEELGSVLGRPGEMDLSGIKVDWDEFPLM